MINQYTSIKAVINQLKPRYPVYIFRKSLIADFVSIFQNNFQGNLSYAVKANTHEFVLESMIQLGVKNFTLFSLGDIEAVYNLICANDKQREGRILYMNPVKNIDDIHDAYYRFGVRDFVVDCKEELQKIHAILNNVGDLRVYVRIAIDAEDALIKFSRKFGVIHKEEILELFNYISSHKNMVGVCFNLGSQCYEYSSFIKALAVVNSVVSCYKGRVDVINIGGGFPISHRGESNQENIKNFLQNINQSISKLENIKKIPNIYCEPGRALVAEAGSVLVRIEKKKGNILYINEGVYGSLFDAGILKSTYPVIGFSNKGDKLMSEELRAYSFFGPSCDDIDFMQGPFELPIDIKVGDYIEIKMLGAYGTVFCSNFNGQNRQCFVEVIA